tara:strand:- start:4 stop:687 length:684 start_codon:yes stop_codon:yes gene_type:complete
MPTPRPNKKILSNLKSSILRPALTSHYQCWFAVPVDLIQNDLKLKERDGEFISLSCTEAALPGTSLATHEMFNDATGVTERHAYRRQYDATSSFTFYVDTDYHLITFFEKYIGYIVNDPDNDNYSERSTSELGRPDYNYRVKFPIQYQGKVYINKFEKDYGGFLQYTFEKAYPISINSMPVTYDASQLLRCTVNFNFSRYYVRTLPELPTDETIGANDLAGSTAGVA